MIVGKAIYYLLTNATGVTDIVSTRVYPEVAQQDAALPYIVYNVTNNEPTDTKPEPSKLDTAQVEVNIYSDSYTEAIDLAVAVRAALDRVKGTYNGVNVQSIQYLNEIIDFDEPQRAYNINADYDVRISRSGFEIAQGSPITGVELGELSDVNVAGATDNQVLSYDAATDTWIPANDGGAIALDDLSDVDAGEPEAGQLLSYGQGDWTTIAQDELEVPISSVTGLQAALDATPDALDDLTDVKIVGTPSDGDALVYSSGFWSRGTAGASTLGELDDVNTTGAGVGSTITYNGSTWEISGAALPSDDVYYHNRYATEAETLRAGATATVELYYTAQADGDGYAESAESDTATTGYDIRRKLYYSEAAQADCDTGTWVQFADIADDTTFASAKATLLAYLKERTGGTVPISLKMTWEEVAEAPSFTGLLNESYGSGAAAAYSVRRLNGNYTGAAIQVERSSDNTTQDIGFDVDGNLDESALETFCTGTVCKVRTWYDQSVTGGTGSGNDAVQTTHANQPTIYTGGAIVKENGRVALDFDGTDELLPLSDYTITNASNKAAFIVAKNEETATVRRRPYSIQASGSTRVAFWNDDNNTSDWTGNGFANSVSITGPVSTRHLLTGQDYAGSQSIYLNGVAGGTNSSGGTNADGDEGYIGSFNDTGTPAVKQIYDGKILELITYHSDKSTDRTSIESNIGDYFTQNTPLLDTYTGAAAAYSLRKLRTAYTGSAIRVRRASDNTEQDIGFNVFGELDTVSLASFCSGTNGFVATWYDQSGNARDLTQVTTSKQYKIFDSVTGYLGELQQVAGSASAMIYSSVTIAQPYSVFGVADFGAATTGNVTPVLHDGLTSSNRAITAFNKTGDVTEIYAGSGLSVSPRLTAGERVYASVFNGTSSTLHANSSQILSGDAGTDNYVFGTVANRYNQNAQNNMDSIKEFIIWPSDQSSNRTNIEDNINTFYSIY